MYRRPYRQRRICTWLQRRYVELAGDRIAGETQQARQGVANAAWRPCARASARSGWRSGTRGQIFGAGRRPGSAPGCPRLQDLGQRPLPKTFDRRRLMNPGPAMVLRRGDSPPMVGRLTMASAIVAAAGAALLPTQARHSTRSRRCSGRLAVPTGSSAALRDRPSATRPHRVAEQRPNGLARKLNAYLTTCSLPLTAPPSKSAITESLAWGRKELCSFRASRGFGNTLRVPIV